MRLPHRGPDRAANRGAASRVVRRAARRAGLSRARGPEALLAAIRAIIARAPLYTPRMPKSAKPMSVRMTNCGALGWMTMNGATATSRSIQTPERPGADSPGLLQAWATCPAARVRRRLVSSTSTARCPHGPSPGRDEEDLDAPVVSLSLGETCLFRIGGTRRNDPTRSFRLASGDALCSAARPGSPFTVSIVSCGTSTLLAEGAGST